MSSNRSPRYPYVGLEEAIEMASKIFDKEGRAPVTKNVVAQHIGYKGLNGSSLKAISALRKYGLVDDVDDALKISQDAIVILANKANPNSQDRIEALKRAAFRVELFADLHDKLGPNPSESNLSSHLMVAGFSKEGSVKAARSYLATMGLVAGLSGGYKDADDDEPVSGQPTSPHRTAVSDVEAPVTSAQPNSKPQGKPDVPTMLNDGERELTTGLLSKGAGFRLFVHGKIGPKELDRLIQKLQLDRDILADPDTDPSGDDAN